MSPRLLLYEFRRRGVAVRVEDGRLRLRGDQGQLTPELVACAKDFKAELIDLLVAETNAPRPVRLGSGVDSKPGVAEQEHVGRGLEEDNPRLDVTSTEDQISPHSPQSTPHNPPVSSPSHTLLKSRGDVQAVAEMRCGDSLCMSDPQGADCGLSGLGSEAESPDPEPPFVHPLDRPRPQPIPSILADRTIGRVQPDPPKDVADLAGKPLDFWRFLVAGWAAPHWSAWQFWLDRHRTGTEGPDDLDLLERRAFDSVLSLAQTLDPRTPTESAR